jgi:hypothetical protein
LVDMSNYPIPNYYLQTYASPGAPLAGRRSTLK